MWKSQIPKLAVNKKSQILIIEFGIFTSSEEKN
jgi:hypothetical protein